MSSETLDCGRSWMRQWLQDAGMAKNVANDRLAEFERLVREDERQRQKRAAEISGKHWPVAREP